MNVHIFNGEGLYKKNFLEFMDSHFDLQQNLILLRNPKNYDKSLYKQSDNIIVVQGSVKYFTIILKKLNQASKIYIHFLPPSISLLFWFIFQNLLKKTIWILWGGDLYYHVDREKNLTSNMFEFLRKKIIKKIPLIACFIKGDYELAKIFYKSNAQYCYVVYPLPVKFDELGGTNLSLNNDYRTILLGNSASPQNNHIEILKILSKFKNEKIKIICPLSYANESTYAEEVIEYGIKVFGDKFQPLTQIIDPDVYKTILAKCDVAIMNHNRQQGLGNVLALLYLGKKVFLRSDTTPFSYFTSLGINISDTKEVNDLDFKSLFSSDETTAIKNKNILAKEFSLSRYIKIWDELLNIRLKNS